MTILGLLVVLTTVSVVAAWVCLRTVSFRHSRRYGYALVLLAAVLVSLPVSVAIVFSATPFWNWLGRILGVRLVTHGGPVGWCYLPVFVVCVAVLGSLGVFLARHGEIRRDSTREG